ncbi:MAG TPA: histone deacetylase [Nitrospirota bacterium]|nr:histone deacetylase [Nitrospirota bacterium]
MPTTAIVRDNRYLEHSAGPSHPESADRLRIIHDLVDTEFSAFPVITPRLATEDELALIHDPFYIQRVASTAGRDRSQLDPDTGLSARSYEIACLAAGGLLNGIDALFNPQPAAAHLQAVFAFVRPPGHHAEQDRAMGFCIFNNVAVAAAYAEERYGIKRILIVDWDLHHGNGTQHAFYNDRSVLFFSSHQFPYYPGSGNFDEIGTGKGAGFTVNAPFPRGFGDAEYVHIYSSVLKPIALEYKPELILVSAGFDPYFKDPLGGMRVTGLGFGALASVVRDLAAASCPGKLLFTLEGGYNGEGLRNGVRAVLHALASGVPVRIAEPHMPEAEDIRQRMIAVHRHHWKSLI